MAYKTPEREFPWCTAGLVFIVFFAHVMVLMGNLSTASSIGLLGGSAKGWANVGVDMARTFTDEIDYTMGNMTDGLTQAINMTVQLQEMLDVVIGSMGEQTEKALLQVSLFQQVPEGNTTNETNSSIAKGANNLINEIDDLPVPLPNIMKNVAKIVVGAVAAAGEAGGDDPLNTARALISLLLDAMMMQVNSALDMFLDMLEPVLLKVGEWYMTFGDKLQASIEQFTTAVDIIQKLMDQIMAQAGAGGDQAEEMEYNTYNLFAVSDPETGITVQDLQDVAAIYSISPLQGPKAEDVFQRFDVNKDAVIDRDEYSTLVLDPSLPGVMALVLRSYAKRLSQVSGVVGRAVMRDEVANGVVQYLQLVCAKNYTKVEWIAERLTNNSLPMAFTAAVMRNLALLADDPEVLTTADVGSMVISAMAAMNPSVTTEGADLMANTTWWVEEGFEPSEQQICVERVSKWTAATLLQLGHGESVKANLGLTHLHSVLNPDETMHVSLLEGTAEAIVESFGAMARRRVEENRKAFYLSRHKQLLMRHEALTRSIYSQTYYNSLLGGRMASHLDPQAASAVSSGTPAVPETLEFARFLSSNATSNSMEFQSLCFNYSGMSSTPADAIATQISSMVKKTQGFLSQLDEYAGEGGMEKLRNKTSEFVEKGKEALEDIIIAQFNKSFGLLQKGTSRSEQGGLLLAEERLGVVSSQPASPLGPGSDIWLQTLDMLEQLEAVLPPCIDSLKTARKEVAKVGETLGNGFETFLDQAPPIFYDIATYYRYAFIGYFILMIFFPLGILYYGFYANGYFGGPKADEIIDEDEYEEPQGCYQKLCACCACCCTCIRDWWRGEFCFWTFLILGQLFVVILFVLAMLFIVLAGIDLFLASGCEAIYVLNDTKACSETLLTVQRWVKTFNAGAPQFQIENVCEHNLLTTCNLIQTKLKSAALFTAAGSVVAAIFSFFLLIQACIIHERTRMIRVIDGLVKQQAANQKKAASSGSA